MGGALFTGFLDEDRNEGSPMDLRFLVELLRQMKGEMDGNAASASPWGSFFPKDGFDEEAEGYSWTDGKKYLLIAVTPAPTDKKLIGGEALGRLRRIIADARRDFPDINVGVTGQKALDEDERSAALGDMGLATALSFLALLALLALFWRNMRRPFLQMATMLTALSLTFGFATLVIGHLNLLSITFAPMLLGLGIDYDIHWFARYTEERQRTASTRRGLSRTMEAMGSPLLVAGSSTALCFLSLTLAGFKGLVELGLICGVGLILAPLMSLCLLPALITLFDRHPTGLLPHLTGRAVPPLFRMTRFRVVCVLVAAVIAGGLSILCASRVRFDLNMLQLQSRSAESVQWEKRLIEDSKRPSIHGAVFTRSLEGIEERAKAIERLPTVSEVQSIRTVLPADQGHKIALLHSMAPLLEGVPAVHAPSGPVDVERLDAVLARIKFKLLDAKAAKWGANKPLRGQMTEARSLIEALQRDFRSLDATTVRAGLGRSETGLIAELDDKLSLLKENMNTRPMQVQDVPEQLRKRFVGPDGTYLLRVLPSENIWEPRYLSAFVKNLQAIEPDATGDPVTLFVFTKAFRDATIRASLYALAFITLFLALTLRSPVQVLAALVPLLAGSLWTFGLMQAAGIDLNLANSIFMPLVVGAGVEYGVIVVQRWRRREEPGSFALPSSTGMGLVLAGLTTTIGFASLMISDHRGIHSLGVLTTIGSLAVLAAAVVFLPVFLHLFSLSQARKSTSKRRPDATVRFGGEQRRKI
jgi:hopanoid biosynthesis associated RND transporter like protein HpnN